MLRCQDISRIASESHERPLSFRERWSLNIHILFCDGCRNFAKQVRLLRRFSRAFAKAEDKDPD